MSAILYFAPNWKPTRGVLLLVCQREPCSRRFELIGYDLGGAIYCLAKVEGSNPALNKYAPTFATRKAGLAWVRAQGYVACVRDRFQRVDVSDANQATRFVILKS